MKLWGTWRLKDYTLVELSGRSRPIWPGVAGQLILAEDSSISAVIVRQPARDLQAGDIIAYAGTYSVDGDRMSIKIAVSNVPWHSTTEQQRTIKFESGVLVMTLENHPRGTHIVRWTRD
jgi:hypothetical protein